MTPPDFGQRSERVGRLLGILLAPWFAIAAFLRGQRVLHARGVAHQAELVVADEPPSVVADTVLGVAGARYRTVARISRGAGLPLHFEDVRGLALRIHPGSASPFTDQDVMLGTVRRTSAGFDLVARARTYAGRYSSLLLFRAPNGSFRLEAIPLGIVPDDHAVHQRGALNGVAFELRAFDVNGDAGVPNTPVGVLTFGPLIEPASSGERLRFDPWRAGGAIEPTGTIVALRNYVYKGGQLGRALRRR